MRVVALLLVAGCYSPQHPSGVICDPLSPVCPDGEVCRPQGDGHVCKEPGIDDDAGVDVPPDVATLTHLRLEQGWTASVFHDFSSVFMYRAMDWTETTEVYDNQPSYLFPLFAPYVEGLAVIAGRRIFTLDGATTPGIHNYGIHAPNIAGLPDALTGGVFVPGATPSLFVSSSSENTGDGIFRIDTNWEVTGDTVFNNTRSVLHDATGAFDARGSAETYLGAQNGIVRRADGLIIITGDSKSLRLVDTTLYVSRQITSTTQRLIRITSTTHVETILHESTRIRIGDGDPPSGFALLAILDDRQLVAIATDGTRQLIAELVDASWTWQHVVAPPAGHPLAGRVYILESNRMQDIDRVIALRLQ